MLREITDLHHSIARENGFKVYQAYPEKEAAKLLGMHFSTLRRIRSRQDIGFLKKGKRSVSYFGYHLLDYLLAQETCPNTQPKKDTKLVITGSPKGTGVRRGTECGSIKALDKHAVLASAQRILKMPKQN